MSRFLKRWWWALLAGAICLGLFRLRFDVDILNLLPPDERPVMRWNANPFEIDGGDGGNSEDDGAAFLLPYWLGRYQKLLVGE